MEELKQGKYLESVKSRQYEGNVASRLTASYLSYPSQDYLPRCSTHNRMVPPTLISNQENVQHRQHRPPDRPDGCIFSTEVPFPQMTLSYVKLIKKKKKTNQHRPQT